VPIPILYRNSPVVITSLRACRRKPSSTKSSAWAFDNRAEHEAHDPQGEVIEEQLYPRAAAFRQVRQLGRTLPGQRGERL
jgi:hypothetical protein